MFKRFKILFSSMLLALTSIGFSSWVFLGSAEGSNLKYTEDSTLKVVAYIKSNSNVKYTSIEKALEVANASSESDEIYVIPGTNPIITRNCKISSNDKLYLPFEDETIFAQTNGATEAPSGSTSKYNESYEYSSNCYNIVTISSGVTLTINSSSSLIVGANQFGGQGGAYLNGCVGKKYTKIVLLPGAHIYNYGTLECNGYIMDSSIINDPYIVSDNDLSSVICYSGSVTYGLFNLIEHRGGTDFYNMLMEKSFSASSDVILDALGNSSKIKAAKFKGAPFNRFYFSNIESFLRLYAGSKFYAKADLYANSQHNSTTSSIYGDDSSFFIQQTTGYIDNKFNRTTKLSVVNVCGSCSINSIVLSLAISGVTININSTDFLLAISYFYEMNFNSFNNETSVVTCNQGIKVLTGGKLNVGENVIFDSNKDIMVYETFTDKEKTPLYPSNKPAGILTVNGTLTVPNIGGKTESNNIDGKLVVTSGCEVTDYHYNMQTAGAFVYEPIIEDLQIKIYNQLTSTFGYYSDNLTATTYPSYSQTGSIGFVIDTTSCKIINTTNKIMINKDLYINGYPYFNDMCGDNGYVGFKDLSWTSSDTSIATITKDTNSVYGAIISGVGLGDNVTITLSITSVSGSVFTDTLIISVEEPGKLVTSISLGNPTNNISVGDSYSLNAIIAPEDAQDKSLLYSSSNTAIATIDTTGKYTGIGTGTCTIKATSIDGSNIEASFELTVTSNIRITDFSFVGGETLAISKSKEAAETKTVTLSPNPATGSGNFTATSLDTANLTVSISGNTLTLTTVANNTITVSVKVTSTNGVNGSTIENTLTVNITKYTNSCIIEGTLITLGDGTYKKVEDIVSGDVVQVFNHETGEVETSHVVFNEGEEKNNYEVMECQFEDSLVEVISEHAFFDLNLNKYVYINEDTINDFIGDDFVMIKEGIIKSSKLLSINVITKNARVYGLNSYKTLNFINNNMLSIEGNISGLFNIFEYEKDTLKYDPIKKQQDIDLYGLLTIDDYQGMISEYMFEAFNGAYLGISIEKGLITWDSIKYLAELYAPLC